MEISSEPSTAQRPERSSSLSGWVDWLVGARPSREAVRQNEAQQAQENNELLPNSTWAQQTVFASPEDEWRHDCLAFARVKDLSVVEDMNAFYVEQRGHEREEEGAEPIVVAVGAHYKANVASPEEVILYIVKEMEKVGPDKPYTLVYFHAGTSLPTFPDTAQLQQIHAALHSSHKRNLKAFYVVHPTVVLKYWIFMLRLAIPEIYGKVEYVHNLADLHKKLPAEILKIPQHVIDHDQSLRQ